MADEMDRFGSCRSKAEFRSAVQAYYDGLSDEDRFSSDQALWQRFLTCPEAQADTFLLFFGVGNEPNTLPLLASFFVQGKTVALPRCLPGKRMEARIYRPDHLTKGMYGIPEPDESCAVVPYEALQVVLVPNLCCDWRGFRIGHGGGYYDRYCSPKAQNKNGKPFLVSLCREALLRKELPVEPHDIPVDLLVTETRSLSPAQGRNEGGNMPRPPRM